MQFSAAFVCVVSATAVIAHAIAEPPTVTAAPYSPSKEYLMRAELLRRNQEEHLMKREDLHFCYSKGSICEAANNLFDVCDNFIGLKDSTQYYQCICEGGWVSTSDACHWCDIEFGISDLNNGPTNTKMCSSFSFTVAPVPATILQQQSSYNATVTGGPTGIKTGAPASVTSTTNLLGTITSGSATAKATTTSKSTTSTSKSSSSVSSSTITLNGGGGGQSVTTANPNEATVTVAPSPTTSNIASAGHRLSSASIALLPIVVLAGVVWLS
ncbi:hypothetical protein BGZ60DRAFT_437163 [Tricladium varicosporioides]|nr:hypothetical protein BGZ60DRAFT_437163 [Hymenoscyphus varicosporioides]